ncbi:MAG: hypothetical protein Q9177_006503, partial [Variospora cf. flavescens]
MDGVSFQVFLSDLEKAYNGESFGKRPRQFPDYSSAQRKAFENGEMKDELKYWKGVFPAGEQPPILPLLPMARMSSRMAMKDFSIHQVLRRLEPELVARVKSLSKAQRSTPFHFYLAAFKAMLFCFTDAQDLTIGIADANRNHSDVMNSLGFFLNLLTLRFRRQPSQRFLDAVAEARDTTYAALGNSRLPFDVLLSKINMARSSIHSPFFQAFFNYRQGVQEKHTFGDTQFEFQEFQPGRTAYDITLDMIDSGTDALVIFRSEKQLSSAVESGRGPTLDDVLQLKVPNAAVIDCAAKLTSSDLYTSGSTGTPKGIIVTHSGLRNEIEGYTKTWKLGAERTLQQSAYTFNHSSDQIYTGLVNGGMVYTVPWSKRGDPLEITKILHEQSITYTKATPSEYSLWMQYGGDNLRLATEWRRAFGGGEPLSSTITQEFADLGLPQLRVFNSYGPTEISISSTKMEVEYRKKKTVGEGRIPCGYSLPNYATYIVDEQLKPLPAGMPGEICLGGAGVSLGYLNNRDLTSKQFVPDPFASPEYVANGWIRMYRTGDIGHLQDDGAMVFHSRIAGDTQIKIRGLRLELADIESNIVSAAMGMLKEVVVTLREGDPDFIVAHVVFAPQHTDIDKEAFLEHLLSHLPIPQYMIPVMAVPLDKLPLTNHSKVDRKAIKALPLPQRAKESQEEGELTETMLQL